MTVMGAWLVWVLAALPLEPGAYVGVVEGGAEVGLELRAGGEGTFAGAAVKWALEDDVLTLRPAAGAPYELRVSEAGEDLVLTGPPHGRITLRPAKTAAAEASTPPPPVPLPWVGGWRHTATGGSLVLRLVASGVYEMEQSGASIERTTGRWVGDLTAGTLTMTPDGGEALVYRAKRDGEALMISGGDLPTAVRFLRDTPR